ncbi:hypothetical protein GQ651_07115 [Alphaproteobacteria bacterium GH1-50]|uniref:Uncharacterized protein n=1 Tax=Kangsaoukella pontilimi TaxID=2691042 RepID=A0A7C9M9X6_9RHOB|nr:hypothetical protein [Kangsaoukella pontilimi]MXQ07613.1 hypothetical protein [Kangsaoukella pontilimi]
MARPNGIPPQTPPSQAADHIPEDVTLPEPDNSVPADPGNPSGLPLIPVQALYRIPPEDLPDEAEPGFPDFLLF